MSKVTVYFGKVFDAQRWETVQTERKGTLEWLAKIKAEPLFDTAEEVDSRDIDGEGRVNPKQST